MQKSLKGDYSIQREEFMSESRMVSSPAAPSEIEPIAQASAVAIAENMVTERSRQFATERTRGIGWTAAAFATDAIAFAAGVPQQTLAWTRDFAFDVFNTPGCVSGFDTFSRKYVGVVQECLNRVNAVTWDITGPLRELSIWADPGQVFKEYSGLFFQAALLGGAAYTSYRALRSWFRDQPRIINQPFTEVKVTKNE